MTTTPPLPRASDQAAFDVWYDSDRTFYADTRQRMFATWQAAIAHSAAQAPAAPVDNVLQKLLTERRRAIVTLDDGRVKLVEDRIIAHIVVRNAVTPAAPTCTPADERALFEQCHPKMNLTRSEDGRYVSGYTQISWEGWQDRPAHAAIAHSAAQTPADERALKTRFVSIIMAATSLGEQRVYDLADGLVGVARAAQCAGTASVGHTAHEYTEAVAHEAWNVVCRNLRGLSDSAQAAIRDALLAPLYATHPAPVSTAAAPNSTSTK